VPRASVRVERNVIRLGEPIVGEVEGDRVYAVFSVWIASTLLTRGEAIPSARLLYKESMWIEPGRFELSYPSGLPPTISTRAHKVRWAITFGVPRLGGRVLFPRSTLRIKAFPPTPDEVEADMGWLILNKGRFYPEDEVLGRIRVRGVTPEDVTAEVLVREWLELEGERREYTWTLAPGDVGTLEGEAAIRVQLPHDPTVPKDLFFFFPYTFSADYGGVRFGTETYLVITLPEGVRKVPLPISPKTPRFEPTAERRGPPLW